MSEAFKAWLKEAIVQGSKLLAEQAKAPPSLEEIVAMDTDITNGLSADEHVRRLRRGDCDPAPDDAAAIEAAERVWMNGPTTEGAWVSRKRAYRAYHAEASKRDAATIAELRKQLAERDAEGARAAAFLRGILDDEPCRIVCSGDLTEHQIAEAQRVEGRFLVLDDGIGFAAVPWTRTTKREDARNDDDKIREMCT